jgi:hypothetical protein
MYLSETYVFSGSVFNYIPYLKICKKITYPIYISHKNVMSFVKNKRIILDEIRDRQEKRAETYFFVR